MPGSDRGSANDYPMPTVIPVVRAPHRSFWCGTTSARGARPRQTVMILMRASCGLALAVSLATTGCLARGVKLMAGGSSHELRKRPEGTPPNSPNHPPILVLALDGVGRDILYESLRKGEMPELARLLGGSAAGKFPHAYLDESLISTLPSTTMAAWVTTFTGVGPAYHGVTGNEFFIREERRFAAPAPRRGRCS